jgi:NitT/TauT family transport system substrate-binding protein
VDPLAGAYKKLLQDGVDAGTTKQADINGIFDLTALNSVTAETGGDKVSAAGLGKD